MKENFDSGYKNGMYAELFHTISYSKVIPDQFQRIFYRPR